MLYQPIDGEGRHMTYLNRSMKSHAEILRYIERFKAAHDTGRIAIRMENYIDDTQVFHVAAYYEFTLGGIAYREILRRLTCKWNNEDEVTRWTLEFGEGKTFGKERMFRFSSRNDGDLNELKLR
jgi:hypothetical protein